MSTHCQIVTYCGIYSGGFAPDNHLNSVFLNKRYILNLLKLKFSFVCAFKNILTIIYGNYVERHHNESTICIGTCITGNRIVVYK